MSDCESEGTCECEAWFDFNGSCRQVRIESSIGDHISS